MATEKKKMESSQMNFEDSLHSLNYELTAGKFNGSAGGAAAAGNSLANSGRNQMNNEYKSYLQGSTSQTPGPGGPLGIANKTRGGSMAPAFATSGAGAKMGDIREIEVSKPDLRLSKDLKQKLQSMNQLSPTNNRSPEMGDLDAANKLLKMNRNGTQGLDQTLNSAINDTPDYAMNFSANSYLVKAGQRFLRGAMV